MSNEISTEISPEIINSLVLNGDMSKLSPAQQTQYYSAVCQSLGLNPLTQPFAVMVLNGKKILYAKKDATQQLSNTRKVNTEVKSRETQDSVYVVSVRATLPDGRFTDEIGAVAVAGIKGLELANAMMKCVTKAKRRAVLALCGLGMPDETEIDDEQVAMMRTVDPNKSRVEQLIENQVEEAQVQKPEVKENVQEEKPKEAKKTTKKEPKATDVVNEKSNAEVKQAGTPGVLSIIGLIDNQAQGDKGEIICVRISKEPIINPNNGIASIKHSLLIDGKYYGTWDSSIATKVMECIDNRRFVKFEYKERPDPKVACKFFNDIISFKEATMEEYDASR